MFNVALLDMTTSDRSADGDRGQPEPADAAGVQPARFSLRRFAPLLPLLRILRPYWLGILGASLSLVVSAAMVLVLGQGLRRLVDQGLRGGDTALLDHAVIAILGMVLLLAVSKYSQAACPGLTARDV